ncbi:DNA cytosine methyltransferase [Helicobacter pylori]|nr:DNA cytosine methyltransferase [Helicobacter pylori]WRE46097.1 DNA cytosine methyltransferase [Helicobacter pylori]
MLFDQTLTYISLFSGAGVGCYGLLEEGFECVATNEILEKRLNIQLNPIQSSYQALMRKDSPKLYNHQATNHSQAALEKLKLIDKEQGKECLPKNLHGKQQFKSTWGRLNWNKISPTIDTRFDTPSNGTNSHPELHRSITPREAARIQSFSDNYIFYGNKTSVCKQIGNAVPPLLALALGKAILKNLRK